MAEDTKIPEPPESPETKQVEQKAEQKETGEPTQGAEELNKDARMWAMFCHLSALSGFLPIVPAVGAIIGPLIIWQVKKNEFAFVDEQGKEAVNFQISMLIYAAVAALLIFACVGAVLLPAVIVVDIVFLVIAAIKANKGEHYRYPLCIRFIK